MAGVTVFTDLRSWQRARIWSKRIFGWTKTKSFATDQRLVVQINDSSESVMANERITGQQRPELFRAT
ncbi:MAG: four helix bundle protein [Pirellulaceae bacterium]|jgi:hypothetical protein|nr:four helix bundle protein [Pirellulaceae bacterium]MCU0981657.1 four helix bundle protein [Pirellulaceae bacterium]